MSRTDKDRPHWVRQADNLEDRVVIHRHFSWWPGRGLRECDFNPKIGPRELRDKNCGWQLCGTKYRPYCTAPGWYHHDYWYSPERARERDELRNAAREYNTYGEIEDFDFGNYQHRHNGDWWWW